MKLRQYLDAEDMSAAEFARRIKVSDAAVSRYLRGLRIPASHVVGRIIDATDGRVYWSDLHATALEYREQNAA